METRTTVQITLPAMGESVTEGTVLEWRKQVGDSVEADEPIVEVSTDKVDAEVPAPASGTLTAINVQADETVAVGAILGEISVEEGSNGGDPALAAQASMESDAKEEGELVDVVVPSMGESVSEGTLLEWLVEVGDTVKQEQGLAEISTDKIDAELPSPVAGIVAEILAAPDETVRVGDVLCRISPMAVTAAPQNGGAHQAEPKPVAAPAGNGDVNATPVAARIAADLGIDLSSIKGSGPRGRITKEDVLDQENGATPATAEAKPLRGPAATLARFMEQSRSIPTATSFRTLEVDTLDRRRGALKSAGKKISFTHIIAWAIVEAAEEMPVMAHSFEERDGKPFRIVPGGVNIGLAVDVERKDGTRSLVVPVIHGANRLTFDEFATRYDDAVAGARDNTLGADAYQGANITLTNPGGIGTVASVPRLMPGQGTIIAAGALGYPAGLKGRAKELGISKVMTMTSTYDHRVIQGAESGQFLKTIDGLLQGENDFYEEILEALGVDGAIAAEVLQGPAAGTQVTAHDPVPTSVQPAVSTIPDEGLLQAVQAATSVVKAFRMHGHLAANLDPLGSEPPGDPALNPETVNLTPELMEQIPARVLRIAVEGQTFADALPHLQATYCGTIAYEIEHISDHEQRVWLRQAIESNLFRQPLDVEEKTRLLERLSQVEALESYLHKAFLGKKQFSIEGLDVTVPILDEALDIASRRGGREVVIGMAHRGRLNVLAHTVGRPYEAILAEFEGEQQAVKSSKIALPEGGTGDVKYHHGASGTYTTRSGKRLTVTLSPNPSHLEFVDPVVEGRARADQTSRKGRGIAHDPSSVVPVLVHGDAAFPGQGTVAETLNMQSLRGYATGGTVHLIQNNQIGFTTEPSDARSTRYASDLAKGFDVPIIHVNADDVEASIAAIRLAMAYRDKFARDVVIDLIGYRRFGHNETDEPAYTQPAMYEKIKKHPPVRTLYAQQLAAEGSVSEMDAEELAQRCYGRLSQAHAELKEVLTGGPDTGEYQLDRGQSVEPDTRVPRETLAGLNEQLLKVPEGFTIHRKLKPQIEKRRKAFSDGENLEWAHAESLAFSSLLVQGTPIRLTGQDVERGTFSQRHQVFHDAATGERHTPIKHIPSAQAPFELHNSPLSEQAALGFEYGYSVQAPDALVLWEAQFGDFVNGAQVIVDQFITSGLAKWGQTSRLSLLLPHGYEGSGPEHSSGRLERFLQLCAEGNLRVANLTTPAQYFHLLRRQALVAKQRPLVIMTPKSLLRHPAAVSTPEELATGHFQLVLDDPTLPGAREEVNRLVLCSGKIYYDLVGHDERAAARDVAVARVELLYPFPKAELQQLFASYPNLKEILWVQEEPKNMGARSFMKYRLDEVIPVGVDYDYVGRELRASPGEGYAVAHRREQDRIVRVALGDTRLYRDASFLGPLGTA
ncbi:MAG TPA: multifunctional oxoglutarate decarboxylase/oxoglutarate dehydrogenase thiamine pyrophosphate-binding subunit/dihydrolipoyllysine-residue succinyltransferase subunit [Thermoleophilaceae bacterium]|nr:multifunctional oxoglutarate decarboxylase/oxoglutarate dehydrogenase thiamine pyrophosphate-binding subunit/dihydrolipoyllysine-residue succinyltransferase subunit [Thermoleophilaceae bacterium]